MKYCHTVSRVSGTPARFAAARTLLMMSSWSSGGKSPGMLPEDNKSFMKTKNRSSVICESVKRKEIPSPLTPQRRYTDCRSPFKSLTP